jgi:23S rRNA pseudouridine1911/1915/1917 synthase
MMNPEKNLGDYTPSTDEVLQVPENEAGQRLDQALARLLPRYSRSRLQAWIKAGQLHLDGKVQTEGKTRLRGGERLILNTLPNPERMAWEAEAIALHVVFEDEDILVINKPAGLVAHPGSGNWSGTLMNALLHHDPGLQAVPRAGIVHRLDKDTSGLLVVARTLVAQAALVSQLQAHSVRREYLAVALGAVMEDGRVDMPIARHPVQRVKMAVVAGGKPAVTHYRVLRRYPGATFLACRLETGRTHQIRVHMAYLGHPLLGDPVYGRALPGLPTHLPAFPRQALHATRLEIKHPTHGATMAWEAPLPEDMRALLDKLEHLDA